MVKLTTDAKLTQLLDGAMRRVVQEQFPDLLPELAKKYPELYGPDSLFRIQREFPEFFGQSNG